MLKQDHLTAYRKVQNFDGGKFSLTNWGSGKFDE